MLTSRLADARGSALVPALLITAILLTFGMASLTLVEGDQRDSRRTRERESSFQLAEGVLNAQIYRLSTRWPAQNQEPYAAECTAGSTQPDCPGGASLQANFSGPDYTRPNAWRVQVRDNESGPKGSYYSESLIGSSPARDANGDGFVWVRAEATVADRRRVLVALVEAENVTLNFPRAAVVAGGFETSNKGAKTIIDTNGTSNEWTPAGDVIVRCDTAVPDCATYEHSDKKQQVEPPTVRSNPTQPKAVSPEALEQLRLRAKAEGNYHAGCPPEIKTSGGGAVPPGGLQGRAGPGGLVFIENAAGCQFNGNTTYNTPAKPGYVVIARGMPTLNGTADFYGVIYHANEDESSGTLINLTGNISIVGSIVIDGAGRLSAGSSKINLIYNPNVFAGLTAFGTAGIVQNTFREIRGA